MTGSARIDGPIVVSWERFGPYHHARLKAAAGCAEIIGLEVSELDTTYAWDEVKGAQGFARRLLFAGRDASQAGVAEYEAAITRELAGSRPAAIAVPGWAARHALTLLRWARRRGIPTILMSESTAADTARTGHKERVKRRLVGMYAAALVGGTPHRNYLAQLGFPPARVFDGYDSVDNAHFTMGAASARRDAARHRSSLDLPGRYFLASGRFIPQKNLLLLLDAYAIYRRDAGTEAWSLVVLGDGPLRPEIEFRRAALGIAADVRLPGFRQYDELPAWYGLASAFVHPATSEPWGLVVNEAMAASLPVLVSRHCGCAPDLVREGRNGFTFDPSDPIGLAALMTRIHRGAIDLPAMARTSRSIIDSWDQNRFALGLAHAVSAGMAHPPARFGPIERCLVEGMLRL